MYVVLFHSEASKAMPGHVRSGWAEFIGHGYLAVSFFFILSGFVLTWNYGDRWQEESYKCFLIARFARIYPVYLLALLMQLPFCLHDFHVWRALAVLLMIQSWTTMPSALPASLNYPSWTLSIEWSFYLCFPVLLSAVMRLRSRKLAVVSIILLTILIAGPQAGIGGRLS